MMKRAFVGGLAALSLLVSGPVLAQIHGGRPNVASPTAPASLASSPAPSGPAPAAASKAKARYADCMRRYHDRKGCRYLAWRRIS